MKNKKNIFFFISIIAVFLFAFQYMNSSLSGNHSPKVIHFLVNLPVCILIGIFDFLIINMVYKKLRNKDQIYIRVSVDLLLTALFAVLVGIIANFMLSVISPDKISSEYSVIKQSLPLLLWNSIIVLLIEVFFYSQRQIEAEKKIAVFEKEKIQYQYEVLKAQINPHFLFNSLNVLSSLVYEDAEKANLFAKKMSGVYRYLLLTNARTTVTLKEELAFLESYIFLESIRFENALLVDINNKADLNKQVIPVSLQLLVENAIKHNITTSAQPLTVRINIANDGITVSNHLQLRSSVDKGGVGLANLQKQYALFQKTIRISKTKTEFTVQMPFVG